MKETPTARLGRRVAEVRRERGLRQREVAKLLGADVPTISRIEHGKKRVDYDDLHALARALGVELSELLEA